MTIRDEVHLRLSVGPEHVGWTSRATTVRLARRTRGRPERVAPGHGRRAHARTYTSGVGAVGAVAAAALLAGCGDAGSSGTEAPQASGRRGRLRPGRRRAARRPARRQEPAEHRQRHPRDQHARPPTRQLDRRAGQGLRGARHPEADRAQQGGRRRPQDAQGRGAGVRHGQQPHRRASRRARAATSPSARPTSARARPSASSTRRAERGRLHRSRCSRSATASSTSRRWRRATIQVVPEYAATLAEFLNSKVNGKNAKPRRSPDIDTTMTALKAAGRQGRPRPSARRPQAQDQNAFAVTTAFADKYGVKTLSDLAAKCSGTATVLGGPPECPQRPKCQPGWSTSTASRPASSAAGPGGPLTKTALKTGSISVGLVFSSDGGAIGRPAELDRPVPPARLAGATRPDGRAAPSRALRDPRLPSGARTLGRLHIHARPGPPLIVAAPPAAHHAVLGRGRARRRWRC